MFAYRSLPSSFPPVLVALAALLIVVFFWRKTGEESAAEAAAPLPGTRIYVLIQFPGSRPVGGSSRPLPKNSPPLAL